MKTATLLGVLIAMAWFSVCPPATIAQADNVIKGTVEDPSGDPVAQAVVKLTRQPDGPSVKVVTDASGNFVFAGVAPGDYLLHVKMEGFEKAELNVQVGTTPTPRLRLRLKVVTVSQEITVSARSVDAISPEQNATAVQLDQDLLKYLPAKNDAPLAVASLFVDPAANGAEGTKIVVDGVEGDSLDVPTSSVKTIAVNKNPYSTEFGRPGRGRIEVTTRGGSLRRFHHRIDFSFRDASLDARNAFDAAKSPRRREFFAGQVDGPLVRDKVTFFLSGQHLRDNDNAFISAQTPSGLLAESLGIPLRRTILYGRTDIRLTPLHILSVRYNWSLHTVPNQGVGAFDLPDRAWNQRTGINEVRISEIATPSTNFSNEVRFYFKSRTIKIHSLTDAPAVLVLGAFNSGGGQMSKLDREKVIDLQELVSYIHGKHTFRIGAIAKSRLFDYSDSSNFGGTFTFSDLAAYASKQPFEFTVIQGDPGISFNQHEFAYFLQDEIRLPRRFSLLVGLRHELQSNLQYHKNLAPRVALSYATPDGRTVLRAGAGIFYERQPVAVGRDSLLLNGSRLREIVISNPSFPLTGDPSTLANLAPPPSVWRIDPNIRAAYAIQASLGVERKLGRQSYLSAEYTTLRGLRLYRAHDVNAPLPTTDLRPNPNFLNIDQFETSGSSHSHSLNLGFRTSMRKLQLFSQYTFSHTIDDTSGLSSLPANNFDLRAERGLADFDQRHRLTLAGVLKLPRGFGLGLIVSVHSGIPFNVTTGFDNNNDTVANDRPSLGNPNAPFASFGVDGSFVGGTPGVLYDGAKALVTGGGLVPANANAVHWLILPGVGNIGRNVGSGPGYADMDVRFSKKFVLQKAKDKTDTTREVEFRFDAFNALNHVNFRNYVGTLTSPDFGRANAAFPPREIQTSVRVSF